MACIKYHPLLSPPPRVAETPPFNVAPCMVMSSLWLVSSWLTIHFSQIFLNLPFICFIPCVRQILMSNMMPPLKFRHYIDDHGKQVASIHESMEEDARCHGFDKYIQTTVPVIPQSRDAHHSLVGPYNTNPSFTAPSP